MTVRRAVMVACAAVTLTFAAATPGRVSAVPLPGSFLDQARLARQVALSHIAATERASHRGHYAYYTVDNVRWKYTGPSGWAAGFVPGELWSCYQFTGDSWWRDRALSREAAIGESEISVESLNLGALFYPSFARGFALTGDPALRAVALEAAHTMAGRYDPVVGAMLSRPGEEFNVIIDSLMKSQLLWWAARNGGPPEDAEIARRHALTIARDFVREDGSTWHLCYYDAATRQLVRRSQGAAYADGSTWARGQAWALLGFAAAYRESGQAEFLDAARKVTDWYLAHVPDDMVPYWDFLAPDIPAAPRDSSAAAIAASGMLDLALHDPDPLRRARYAQAARLTLSSLMSPSYLTWGTNPAVLLHGTYTWSSGVTDRGLAYGDAFFLEALLRLRRLAPDAVPLPVVRARAEKGTPGSGRAGRCAGTGRSTCG
jgi:unsaturated chondroitin disaccharide hydrolase